jgi:hypothetical protein
MRRIVFRFLILLFAMPAVAVYAQTSEKPMPGFTLEISVWNAGELSLDTHALTVRLTNTTNEDRRESTCAERNGWFNSIVTLDGVALEEIDGIQKLRKKDKFWMCNGGPMLQPTKAGESQGYLMYISDFYDMTKPGKYDITVTKETFPNNPEKSITVKSNTLTIIVP